MIRTQIQLTDNQVRTLKKLATSRHVSVAGLIRQAIDAMIQSSPPVDAVERHKRAMDIVGKFSSGKRDVSGKHDGYLADAFGE